MPSSAEHKEKAQQILDFLHSGSLPPEWSAIVAFYAALHLVERLCACDNLHIANHHDRLFWLNKHKKHRAIHADFVALYDASRVARYGTCNQFKLAYPGDTVQKQLIRQNLAAIIRHVELHFQPPAATTPP
jgi:hypothetical protein